MYPAEYLTYGVGSAMNITTSPAGVKSFKIADHLGSTRVLIAQGGGMLTSDYEPFGRQIGGAVTGERKSFIDRENDAETGNYNLGVRSEDDEEGRFLSVDPLWEKYPGLSPYNYCANNPMTFTDRSGDSLDFGGDKFLMAQFKRAHAYLKEHNSEWADKIQFLIDSKDILIKVVRSEEGRCTDQFKPVIEGNPIATVSWAPYCGFQYTVNVDGKEVAQQLSPTSMLVDEFSHAYLFFTDPKKYKELSDVTDPNYEDLNEKYSIESAFDAAKATGEVQYMRRDHRTGSYYITVSPASTREDTKAK